MQPVLTLNPLAHAFSGISQIQTPNEETKNKESADPSSLEERPKYQIVETKELDALFTRTSKILELYKNKVANLEEQIRQLQSESKSQVKSFNS